MLSFEFNTHTHSHTHTHCIYIKLRISSSEVIQKLLDLADLILYTAQATLLKFPEKLVTTQSFGVWWKKEKNYLIIEKEVKEDEEETVHEQRWLNCF